MNLLNCCGNDSLGHNRQDIGYNKVAEFSATFYPERSQYLLTLPYLLYILDTGLRDFPQPYIPGISSEVLRIFAINKRLVFYL